MATGKRTIYNDYSRSKDALRKRIARIEKDTNMFFPSDILEGKTIEEMNSLRKKELEEIAVKFTTRVIEGEVTKQEEIRTGKTQGHTKEDVEERLKEIKETNDWIKEVKEYEEPKEQKESDFPFIISDSDDEDTDSDDVDYDIDDENNDFSYADEIGFDIFMSQFTLHGVSREIADLVDKFLHNGVEKFGLDATRDGIFRAMSEIDFDRRAGYDIAYATSYLESVLERIESEYEIQSGFYHHDSASNEMRQFMTKFQDAVERQEDWSSVY